MDTTRDGLMSLLRQYAASRRASRPGSFLEFVRARNPHVFGHHDCAQPDYLDHVWRCRGLHICRGCTAVIAALTTSAVIGLTTGWPAALSTPAVATIFICLLAASLVPLRPTPRTVLHDVRRIALGILLGSAAAYLVLEETWTPRLIVVGVWVGVLLIRRVVAARRT